MIKFLSKFSNTGMEFKSTNVLNFVWYSLQHFNYFHCDCVLGLECNEVCTAVGSRYCKRKLIFPSNCSFNTHPNIIFDTSVFVTALLTLL